MAHGGPFQPPQQPYPYAAYPPPSPPKKKRTGLKILLGFTAAFVLMAGCMAAFSEGGDETTTATPQEQAASAKHADSDTETKKPQPDKPGVGDVVKDGKFSFKVAKLETRDRVGNEYLGKDAQGEFLLVHVTVKNIGDEAQMFSGSNQKLYDGKGREYEADTAAAIYLGEESKSFLEDINPGNSVKGQILFDVPKGTKPTRIELHDSMFSDGVEVALR